MDDFENLFEVFGGATPISSSTTSTTTTSTDQQPKRPLVDSTTPSTPVQDTTKRSKNTTTENNDKNANQLVSLSSVTSLDNEQRSFNVLPSQGVTKTSAENAAEEYDVFNGYFEQVVVGSDKPENVQDQTQKTCAMQTCYPPLFNRAKYDRESQEAYVEKISNTKYEPAKKYPFTLDPFQAKAVQCIEKNQSVLVAAHTSAGKTVVAEYAIALSLRLGQRVIYTSPIKALSNQKYRELQAEFTDVGLMTGDVTINPTASCLVMTTEILRNMLYKGSEVLREISWVIFDEVHYMRDRSRGVVWEETIILLPHKCRFVFLSATLLNSAEFACWVAKIHNQPCSVIYTNYRPTPLEHYICARGSDGIHLIVDKHGEFRDNNYQKAMVAVSEASTNSGQEMMGEKAKKKKGGSSTNEDEVEVIVRKVKELELDPCIVFSFSKKECQRYAKAMMKIDFCTEEERELITEIYKRAINGLTEQDRKLPQVTELAPLLRQGIGIHHGGLLPILKEVVELLFQEGLLRVLFSTETFSIGLNMPARTVIFTSMFKWDGMAHRALTSGEYIQMSGRAGRRGLDDRGVVILMLNQEVEVNVVKAMMAGPSDPLMSSFKLGYNMLLNLVRLEEANADHLMLRSFYQFQQQRAVPMISSTLAGIEIQRQSTIDSIKDMIQRQILLTSQIVAPQQPQIRGKKNDKRAKESEKKEVLADYKYPLLQIEDIQHYYAVCQNLHEQRQMLRVLLHRPELIRGFFEKNPGRLVNVKACIREGPPPLIGSAASLALLDSYNQPIIVNNNDTDILPLTLQPPVLEGLAVLRANRGILDGDNQNQNPNGEASSKALIRADDLHSETGLIPPGLGLSHGRLAQLANTNKTSFVEVQRRRLKDQELNFGWGIVLNVSKRGLPECVLYGSQTPIPASTGQDKSTERNAIKESRDVTIFDVLLPVDPNTVSDIHAKLQPTSGANLGSAYALHPQTRPCPAGKTPKYIIVPMLASAINAISSVSIQNPTFKSPQDRSETGHRMDQIAERLEDRIKQAHQSNPLPSNLPLVQPILDYTIYDPVKSNGRPQMAPIMDTIYPLVDLFSELKIWDIASHAKKGAPAEQDAMSTDFVRDIIALNFRIAKLHQQTCALKLHNHPLRNRLLSHYYHKVALDGYRAWLNYKLGVVSRDKTLAATLVAMHRVLRNLQLISTDDVITNKGRVACEVSTCDELVGTELLYSSIFNQLDVKQVAALCSCLVFDEGSISQEDKKPKLIPELQEAYNQLEEHLKHVATVVKETNIPIDINKFIQSFNPFLMNIVYRWCEGATFATIMKEAGAIFEGTIVRVMRRLEELLRQFATAAATLGNTELEQKFNNCVTRIKRDIIFAASLYL